jgi:hypothetical protein
VLIVATGAKVERLIPLYAIGVFTSFTLSQAGMAKHHKTHKEPGWRKGIFINGFGALLSFVVLCIFIRFKFMEGAWVILVIVPAMVMLLVRLNKQYESEARELESEAKAACEAPILRRHVVLVFVNRLDQSTARAIQYARALMPDEMRAVHIAIDRKAADGLADEWTRLGLARVPLELVDCPDRRIARTALESVAAELAPARPDRRRDRARRRATSPRERHHGAVHPRHQCPDPRGRPGPGGDPRRSDTRGSDVRAGLRASARMTGQPA